MLTFYKWIASVPAQCFIIFPFSTNLKWLSSHAKFLYTQGSVSRLSSVLLAYFVNS